jgi:hypothetical protein
MVPSQRKCAEITRQSIQYLTGTATSHKVDTGLLISIFDNQGFAKKVTSPFSVASFPHFAEMSNGGVTASTEMLAAKRHTGAHSPVSGAKTINANSNQFAYAA